MNKQTEKLINEFAKIICAETKGGYLEYWSEYRESLTNEQQLDYFRTLGKLCAQACKESGLVFTDYDENTGYHKEIEL